MCLAVPMQVISIENNVATVELAGARRTAGLDIIDPKPQVGDYVIVHAGFVINIIDENEARIVLDDFKIMRGEKS
ncbi:HypC/HybG/HupF family hydrogenase formation chaperone [candidate division KSB1 bacterium]|nr:HypC/HybG/HupF family hydrogenase formation chaperone [candidate division KSB1 bacterium]